MVILNNNLRSSNSYVNYALNNNHKKPINFGFNPKTVAQSKSTYALRSKAKEEIFKNLGKQEQVFHYLGKNVGEVQTITINALGTGAVAPVFIKYNFLSPEDQDTKDFSAGRQIFSAGIAVGTQVGVNIPVQKYISNTASQGIWDPDYDLSIKPTDSFIKKSAKNAGIKFKNKEEFEQHAEEERVKIFNENVDKNIENIKNDKTKYKEFSDNAEKLVNDFKDKKELQLFSKKAEELVRKEAEKDKNGNGLQIFSKKAENLVKTELENNKNGNDLQIFSKKAKYLVNADKNEKEMQKFFEKAGKLIDEEVKNDKNKTIFKNNNEINTAKLNKVKELVTNDLIRKEAKELVKNKIKNVEGNVKGLKTIVGFIVALATLPPACSLLNWSYPRAMKKLFPEKYGTNNKEK